MSGGEGEEEASLEFTPTWVVAAMLKKKHQRPLFEALQKVKEELMLLGFISLMLTVLQATLSKMCIPERFVTNMLPCNSSDKHKEAAASNSTSTTEHLGGLRRLLSESALSQTAYCATKNKVPFLSIEALHHLHVFIFVLAVVHVSFSVLTVFFGGARIRQWKKWEDAILQQSNDTDPCTLTASSQQLLHSYAALGHAVTPIHDHAFIKDHFAAFFLQAVLWSSDKSRLLGIALGFHYGWHIYFYMAFIPFILLLAIGTKLEHIISELAHEVVEKHVATQGDLVVKPSDQHFWFSRPQFALILIHFILFQNAFEIGFFFWIWVQYGFHSCILGKVKYIIPRLVVGVFVQVLCSYSTLPLYAIVTQMGTNFKKAIFDEHVQAGILGWRAKVKKKHTLRGSLARPGSTSSDGSTVRIQIGGITQKDGVEIQPINDQGAKSNG
ncbi:hypothetical protein KSS87_004171 [Heliosperma pusillum]|nr:hypothetical protein KSS87_004171 [Heliosperma pusillum]